MFDIRRRRAGVGATLVLGLVIAALAGGTSAEECFEGPLPGNPNNNLRLCSPSSSELRTAITREGTILEWDVPPPSESTYRSPLQVIVWDGYNEGDVAPGITITGTYLARVDRRIEIAVTRINGADSTGTTGVGTVILTWQSVFETTAGGGAISGDIVINSSTVNQPLPLLRDANSDSSFTAGLRVRVEGGLPVKNTYRTAFTVEDFEGYIVWRWLSDPTLEPEAWGRFNRRTGAFVPPKPPNGPVDSWPGTVPSSTVVRFRDSANFDGLVYHYAVTAFDLGFKPRSGQTYGVLLTSPLESADPDTGELSATQVQVAFRQASPEQFTAVFAYPNPYRQAECSTFDVAGTCQVHFKNVPGRSQLFIYTLAGDLVKEIRNNNSDTGTLSWDTRNGAGEEVASGVYIYKVADLTSGEESFGRLAVIR
jgi:hypothetical protein